MNNINGHIHTGTQTLEVNKTEDFFQDLKNTFNLECIHSISENQINVGLLKRLVQRAWTAPAKNDSHWPPLSSHTLCPLLANYLSSAMNAVL